MPQTAQHRSGKTELWVRSLADSRACVSSVGSHCLLWHTVASFREINWLDQGYRTKQRAEEGLNPGFLTPGPVFGLQITVASNNEG